MEPSDLKLVIVSAGIWLVLPVLLLLYYQKKRIPKVKAVAKVKQLFIFPIRSCPPLVVEQAECTPRGLKYRQAFDRQFLLVSKDDHKRIALRHNITLHNIKISYNKETDHLLVEAPGMPTKLSISLAPPAYRSEDIKTVLWADDTMRKFIEMEREYSTWFSQYMGKEVLLVSSHPDLLSDVNPKHTYNQTNDRDSSTKVAFGATHPYLLLNQKSIDDVNSRIMENDCVTVDSFRGNIVVSEATELCTLVPYEEEDWRRIEIGKEAVICNERPCPRCATIYIDFEKQELRKNKEPMTTMLRYHRGTRGGDKYVPIFGINSSLIRAGMISVGDTVSVTYKEK